MKKKTKLITIALLGMLLFVPFTSVTRAHAPYYVGVDEGDHMEWDLYINTLGGEWDQWDADNMTGFWADAFNQTFVDNMTAVKDTAAKVAIPPQATIFYTIDEIIPDTDAYDLNMDGGITANEMWLSPGDTLIKTTDDSGTFMDFPGWPYYYYFGNGTGHVVGSTPEDFAEDIGYGTLATSAMWATNIFNTAGAFGKNYTNTLFFAPNDLVLNWSTTDGDDFAIACNAGLEAEFGLIAKSYDILVENIANGFTMTALNGTFGTNTQNLTITTTYDDDGLLTYHSFEYGADTLVEIFAVDSTLPKIKATADLIVDHDYTDLVLNWTTTDASPGEYAILMDGDVVVFPTGWVSGVEVQYAVPDGLAPGLEGTEYEFKINFGDSRPNRPNVASDTVTVFVRPAPVDKTMEIVIVIAVVVGFIAVLAVGVIFLGKRKR